MDEHPTSGATRLIERLLASVRRHLATDVAYLCEYRSGLSTVRAVAIGEPGGLPIPLGSAVPLQKSLSFAAITGRIPLVSADTSSHRVTDRLARDRTNPVGAFAAAAVRLPDGSLFGALCVASQSPVPSLDRDAHRFLVAMTEVLADQLVDIVDEEAKVDRDRAEVLALLDEANMATVLQPIVRLDSGQAVGVEALTRFPGPPQRPPDLCFAAAARHGLGIELEVAAVRRALTYLPSLPAQLFLSVNASPATIESGALADVIESAPADRLVIEITEHVAVSEYDDLVRALGSLRSRGIRLAVDDAGAGYASMRHIIRLTPDVIKIDGSLTRDLATDPVARAMATSLTEFADRTGATMVAESIETPQDMVAVRELGIPLGQGYLFAAPGNPEDLRRTYPVTVPRGLQ